jgi:small subunit ribosomal protein S1
VKNVSLRGGAALRTLNTATATTTAAASADKPTYEDFSRLLEQYDFKFNVGDKIVGNVFNIDQRGAYVDIGAKAAAFLPTSEASLAPISKVGDVVEVGQSREFLIINSNDAEGSLTLSLRRMQIEIAWKRVNQLHAEDVTIYGEVVSTNRGGLLVEVEGLRGFVPSSQLNIPTPREELIGQTIPLKLIEVDEERQRLVMSNKRATADKQLESFQVGDVVVGTVQAVKPYGAFVDIGGMNGLLHISQISHERITAVENVLNLGDQLKVMILSQDRERGRVSLSTRKLEPTPGDMLRDPQLVFEKADEMAATFRERVAAAEAAARAEEAALSEEGAAVEAEEA